MTGSRVFSAWILTLVSAVAASAAARAAMEPPPPPPVPVKKAEARSYTLDEILRVSEESAPGQRVDAARAKVAGGIVDAARPWFPENPELEVGGGPRYGAPAFGADLTASLSQRLEIAGEPGLRVAAAEAERGVIDAQLTAARWQVHVDVHTAFLRALVLKKRVAVEADFERESAEILKAMTKRSDAGDATTLDVNVAQADAVASKQARARAEQQYRVQLRLLATISGLGATDFDVSGDIVAGASVTTSAPDEAVRDAQPALALRARDAERADARKNLAERESWPKPTIGFSYTAEALGLGDQHVGIATIGVPLPFWQTNQRERADAALDAAGARADLEATREVLKLRLRASAEVADSASALVRSSRDETIPVVTKSVTMLTRAFELGEIGVVELSLARQRLLSARREQLEAEAFYVDALADLEAASGVHRIGPQQFPTGASP